MDIFPIARAAGAIASGRAKADEEHAKMPTWILSWFFCAAAVFSRALGVGARVGASCRLGVGAGPLICCSD